jgi:hypothetical protein
MEGRTERTKKHERGNAPSSNMRCNVSWGVTRSRDALLQIFCSVALCGSSFREVQEGVSKGRARYGSVGRTSVAPKKNRRTKKVCPTISRLFRCPLSRTHAVAKGGEWPSDFAEASTDRRGRASGAKSKTRPEVALHPLIGSCRVKSVSTESSWLRVEISLSGLYLHDFLFGKNVSGQAAAKHA